MAKQSSLPPMYGDSRHALLLLYVQESNRFLNFVKGFFSIFLSLFSGSKQSLKTLRGDQRLPRLTRGSITPLSPLASCFFEISSTGFPAFT